MASKKLEMSLDDIIKQTKKESKKGGPAGVKKGRRGLNTNSKGIGMKGKGNQGLIKKRRINQIQKNTLKSLTKIVNGQQRRITRRNTGRKNASGTVLTRVATANLVKKLVKKALVQVTSGRRVKGIRSKVLQKTPLAFRRARINALNRVSQRSRAIIRHPKVFALPLVQQRQRSMQKRNRQRPQSIQYLPVMDAFQGMNPIALIPQQSLNFVGKRLQNRRNNYAVSKRPQTIRQQINALRQSNNNFNGRHQQKFVPKRGIMTFGNRNVQNQRRRLQTQPFIDPPNFLQRIPSNSQRNFSRF